MKKNQKARKKEVLNLLKKQKIRSIEQIDAYKLSVCHPHSAGVDLGSAENYVALNPEIAAELDLPIVHTFGTTTPQHEACRDLLLRCGIRDVCMESTGIYWINLHYILTQAGINVCLVNPKMFRMVPGRKTDVLDCQWLQTLHMYGLVRGSFIPEEHVRRLRTYMRLRGKLIEDRSRYVQRMQKAMVEMNLMLVNVIEDVTGKTGMAIIEAILAGERDPKRLASLRDGHCKHTEAELEEAMTGIYKEDQLVALRINHNIWRDLQAQIDGLDTEIGKLLQTFKDAPVRENTPEGDGQQEGKTAEKPEGTWTEKKKEKKKRKARPSKNDIKAGIDLEKELLRICGADLTSLTGIQANAALQIIAEVGTDLSAFPTKEDFTSYLGFSPHNKITGGRVISAKTDRKKSQAAQAFKKVIPSIIKGKSSLSAFYHRINGNKGTAVAITATCRKLAERYYDVITKGEDYIEYGEELYKQYIKERELKYLKKLAKKHNLEIREAVKGKFVQ